MNRRVDPNGLKPDQWSVAEAKARFSEVVALAEKGRPQRVKRYGKDAVVIVSAELWDEANSGSGDRDWQDRPGALLEIFEPVRGLGLHEAIEGIRGDLRDPGFAED